MKGVQRGGYTTATVRERACIVANAGNISLAPDSEVIALGPRPHAPHAAHNIDAHGQEGTVNQGRGGGGGWGTHNWGRAWSVGENRGIASGSHTPAAACTWNAHSAVVPVTNLFFGLCRRGRGAAAAAEPAGGDVGG